MVNKSGVFDYIGQIFALFGETVTVLCAFVLLFGEDAKPISTIFSFGSSGLSILTLLRFLLLTAIIATLRFLIMSDGLITKVPLWLRIIMLFTLAFSVTVVFVVMFDWFSVQDIMAWGMFVLSFGISCAAGTLVSAAREKAENRQLEEGLRRLKEAEDGKVDSN